MCSAAGTFYNQIQKTLAIFPLNVAKEMVVYWYGSDIKSPMVKNRLAQFMERHRQQKKAAGM